MMQKTLNILATMTWLFLSASGLSGQDLSPEMEARAGNNAYDAGEPQEALGHYEKALEQGKKPSKIRFNKGDALYQLEKYADAAKSFKRVARNAEGQNIQIKAYHNLGNARLKAGKLDKSIEAYKEALRMDPGEESTRYNLALAQKLKKEKQKQKKKDQNKKDQNKKDQKQKKNGKKESGQKEQEKKGGKGKQKQQDKQNKKQGQQSKNNKKKQKGDKKDARALSPKEVKRLLKAIEANEAKIQRKVLRKKKDQKTDSKDVEKDW